MKKIANHNKIVVDLVNPKAPPGHPDGEFILNSRRHLVVPCVPPGKSTLNYNIINDFTSSCLSAQ